MTETPAKKKKEKKKTEEKLRHPLRLNGNAENFLFSFQVRHISGKIYCGYHYGSQLIFLRVR